MTPLFPMPVACEQKPAFDILPVAVRHKIEAQVCSKIVSGSVVYGGFSASASFCLDLENGRKIFAKGCHPHEMAHGTQNLRQEISAYTHIPAVAALGAEYIGCVGDGDEDGWMLGLWAWIEKGPVPTARTVVQTLMRLHSDVAVKDTAQSVLPQFRAQNFIQLFFNNEKKWHRLQAEQKTRLKFFTLFEDGQEAERWFSKSIDVLTALQQEAAVFDFTCGLIHGDLHRENIFSDMNGRFYIVDWPNACIGPLVFDLLWIGASFEYAGGETIDYVLDEYKTNGVNIPMHEFILAAAAMTGFWADQAYRAVPEKLPRLRWMQKSMLAALLAFLARQGIVESLPRMKI